MKYRKLRIAWTVGCGIAVVLSVLMWVRTRYSIDGVSGPLTNSTSIGALSRHGGVGIACSHGTQRMSWSVHTHAPDLEILIDYETILGFIEYQAAGNQTNWVFRIRVPYWSLIVLFILFAAVARIRGSSRFSLRTLLIATTAIAILLGAIVYAAGWKGTDSDDAQKLLDEYLETLPPN